MNVCLVVYVMENDYFYTKQSLFVKDQCQVQPEAQREFELKELEGTFIRGHIQ